jgi:nucleoid DNA-binding protein
MLKLSLPPIHLTTTDDHPIHPSGFASQFRFLNRYHPPTQPMTKRDLVVRISEETGLIQEQVLDVIQKTLDYISDAVAKGQTVELRNFGVFEVKIRKARIGRNPNRPETDVPIPARAVVKFKPGKEMRESVIKLTP